MLTRIITAIVALCAFIPVLVFSETWAFPIAMAALSAIASVEMLRCIGMKNLCVTAISVLYGVAFPLFARFSGSTSETVALFMAAFFCFLIVILALSVFSKGKIDITVATSCFTMVLYVVASFTSLVLLRDTTYGSSLYLLAFFGPWISDSAAYFCGRAFGKRKLIPDVSPKKPVEGSIGGIVFTGIAFAVYGAFVILDSAPVVIPYIVLAIMGVLVSIVSQIGDLIASLLKRKYGIKDYGKLFPGHGGVMDRFDSVLITAPVILMLAIAIAFFSLF